MNTLDGDPVQPQYHLPELRGRLGREDGMCDHCNPELKDICYRWKGRTMEDDQEVKSIHAQRRSSLQ